MKKCCCCIPVLGGATFLGVIALLLCVLKLVVSIPFLFGIEPFNPLNNTIQEFYPHVSTFIQSLNVSSDGVSEGIMDEVRKYSWYAILGETIASIVYFIFTIMMILGIRQDMKSRMIPHLIFHMLYIILFIIIGLGVTIIFCFGETPEEFGTLSAAATLILAFFFTYFWVVVKKAYIELGNRDNMYSPAPIESTRDSRNPRNVAYGGGNTGLYPPIQMQELDSFM